MQFAGFTPQQQYMILSKMGYTGPRQEDQMDQALAANPNLAAGLGKMAEVAQKRIDMRLGKNQPKAFAGGGVAPGDVINTIRSSVQGEVDSLQGEVDVLQRPPLTDDLNTYQKVYADAVKGGDPRAIAKATELLQRSQQAYQVQNVPSADEILSKGILEPEKHMVQQDVAKIQPTSNQLIAAGTGQQTTTPQAQTISGMHEYKPEDATATQAMATTATAAPRTGTAIVDPTLVGDKVDTALADVQAATADPTAAATVQGQMTKLMQDFEDGTPPWASGAMREASAIMQRRGMGASSMAGEAIVLAAMQAALPIAAQDAQTFAQFELQNLNNQQQTTIFKAQQRMAGLFTDSAAENAAKQFNAQSENQTNQFFAGLETTVSQFNTAQVNAIRQFNAEQGNITSRFNVEQQTTVDMFRAKEQNAVNTFNTQIKQQRDQFNATNDLVIAQANTQWMQAISTVDTAAQNLANRDLAQTANAMMSRQIDYIHQYERDIMAFAYQSAESAAERNVRLLLADKDLALANKQMDQENEAALSEAFMRIFF